MKNTFTLCFLMWLGLSFAHAESSAKADSLLSISEFVTNAAIADSGFVNYYQIKERHYLEIPDRVLGRDILSTITILKGAQQNTRRMDKRFGYGGDSMNNNLVRFTRHENTLDLVSPDIKYTESGDALFADFYKSLLEPIIHSFEITARSDSSSLIDITDYYEGDSELFGLAGAQVSLDLGGYLQQESYSVQVKSFPENINFRSIRCYAAANPKQSTYGKLQWEVGASWFLLPEKPLKIRLADKRVGYFTSSMRGQVHNVDENEIFPIVNRWRMEPKPEDVQKYLDGELVEPAKPIIFYIDKTMPEYLVEGIREAIEAWQKPFEKLGFKNAILARVEPSEAEDPDFSVEDARYSYISYKASPIPNAYGPSIVDPRSGEIICSHVAVFHSVMDLIQMWYFAMCSPSDPAARIYPLEHNVMSKLVNTVVKHEVGHTLGLRHNFMGSTYYPVDSLRSNSFIAHNGLGTSIMDYERFNYVAQPEDKVTQENLFPRIGVYDDFAIDWGYRYFPDSLTAVQESVLLKQWVAEELERGGRDYVEESTKSDPRVQAEDCGDDVVYASELGMKNLQYIMKHLQEWTNEQGTEDYVLLKRRFYYVLHQYEAYVGHVMQLIGGYYTEDCSCGATNNHSYHAVSAETQQKAIDFLTTYYLQEPEWLLNASFIDKVDFDFDDRIQNPAFMRMGQLMVSNMNYSISESIDPTSATYAYFLQKLYGGLFPEGKQTQAVSAYSRMMQRTFLTQLTINLENQAVIPYNVLQGMKQTIDSLKAYAEKGASSDDDLTSVHYRSILNFIKVWETGSQKL
ncbi:zinc-dependent metalloprotease [Mangrovibacterium diazotrophicum]|uniref:Uncharacterized protein DUF5118 n=1 Tax=Mangrovibacterium diazotrophicum TaxID=1261403 RepID=A0A419WAU5_9BACT|nr:zinc-dependent metalloprotease [Mangrovibacterium diazotrophicum]RKD92544.1 uncharacterized protein DUF5118 [Mangrovibacterium diazotrophicum]